MKSGIRWFSTLLVFVCLAATGLAQEGGVRVGIGVSLDPTRLIIAGGTNNLYTNALSPVNIYIPITGPQFRFEPEVGFYSYTYKSSLPTSSSETDASIFHIGVGGFYIFPSTTSARVYIGPRLGFSFVSTKGSSSFLTSSFSTETSETDFNLGLCVGGEYLFAPQFSLGGEAQVNYISYGKPDVTTTPPPTTTGPSADITHHVITTNILFFVRWYF